MSRRWLLGGFAVAVVLAVAFIIYLATLSRGEAGLHRELTLADFAAIGADNNLRIQLEGNLKDAESVLGKPSDQTPLSSSTGGAISVDQATYPGLTIQYAHGDGTILAVAIRSKAYHTPRGITLGTSERAVLRAYGNPTYRFQGNLQYLLAPAGRIDRYQLTFVLSDGRVSTIWAFIPVQ